MAPKSKDTRPFCTRCRGSGVAKVGHIYVVCHCGRLPDSKGSALLNKQAQLKVRLEEVKKGRW